MMEAAKDTLLYYFDCGMFSTSGCFFFYIEIEFIYQQNKLGIIQNVFLLD